MATGYYLRVGDRTTCGGRILTGDNTFSRYGIATALEGSSVSCGRDPDVTYIISGGTTDTWDEGRTPAGTLDSTQSDHDVVGFWNHKTDDGGVQFNKIRHPPALMLFCWDSVIDKKICETRITFSSALREKMSVPTGKDWRGKTAWYDTLLFGLAPEGKVRIWLQNSAGGDNLPVEPVKITTLSGDKLDACKNVPRVLILTTAFQMAMIRTSKILSKGKKYPYGNW